MSVLLGLLAAATYGSSDFVAGLASRRLPAIVVTAGAQAVSLLVGVIAVVFDPGDGMSSRILLWGLAGGIGAAGGGFALYRGLGGGEMSVVATLAGLVTAVSPVIVGLATGDSLSTMSMIGIAAAIPAIGLVSWRSDDHPTGGGSAAIWGILGGLGFGLVYVSYDRAGSDAGGWPLVVTAGTAILLTVGPALLASRQQGGVWREASRIPPGGKDAGGRSGLLLVAVAGLLAVIANLSFVIATHHGELAVVAILTALYPGFTVILARLAIGEHWSITQKLGLATALVATLLVSLGSA